MTDTNRNGIPPLHTLANTDFRASNGSRYPTTNELVAQKRTRSQLNVSDMVLRLPLSRSPLKDARKVHVKARETSQIPQSDSQQHMPRTSQSPVVDRGEAVAEMEICADRGEQNYEEEEESTDSLFSPASSSGKGPREDNSNQIQQSMWPTGTKKRASPDGDAICVVSSPGGERQSKRAKIDAFRVLGRTPEHTEYHEPLRDPDTSTPARSRHHKRASSTKPTPSPTKVASSKFPPRAQSMPPGGENEVRVMDLTSIPPSPRRSPSKSVVEVRRATSVPPPDEDQMDVEVEENFALLHFTNPTQLATPRANPVFSYAINFATPRESATPLRSGSLASPPSPLTPLPSSPVTEHPPEMQSLLAKQANAKLREIGNKVDTQNDTPTGPKLAIPLMADTASSHVLIRPSSTASTSRPASEALGSSGPSAAFKSRLAQPHLASANSNELMTLPSTSEEKNDLLRADTIAGGSGRAPDTSCSNSGDAERMSTNAPTDLSSAPDSRTNLNAILISRPGVIRSMKPKRGPSALQGSRRVTRSVSMKEQKVKSHHAEFEDATITNHTSEGSDVNAASETDPSPKVGTMPPLSTTVVSKPCPPKSTGAASNSRLPLTAQRSASISKLPPDLNKLKQASLKMFVNPKSSSTGAAVAAGGPTASTSTGNASSSRVAPLPSPSKIPLPASPSKRPSTTQSGSTKPFLFSLGFNSTGTATGTSCGASGRSLATLSHALDKLVVPPPSRPNTSMGFVRADGGSEESTPETRKGKGKSKDDASLPSTFARPTASSLKRATTVLQVGSAAAAAAAKMRGRAGTTIGVFGRGRGTVGIFGKTGDRASKKTNLPVVEGSPVKGSADTMDDTDADGSEVGKPKMRSIVGRTGGVDEDIFMVQGAAASDVQDVEMHGVSAEAVVGEKSSTAHKPPPLVAANRGNGVEIDLTTSPVSADKGKQRAAPPSMFNPASSALHALSESLSSLPQTPTPPKPKVLGTRTGLRSSTAAAGKESPAHDGSGSVGSSGNSEVHGSGDAGPSSGTVNGSGGVKKSTLKILKRCAIFVDVRTEQGDDAGSLFVDMLKGLGAKIMGRLGRSCTHIIYKNGHPNTLTRYRMLNDPKPAVVGIAWVVECVEKRARLDEAKFKIDVDMINVAGGNHKRRRSMLPKHLIPSSPDPEYDMPLNMSSEVDEDGADGVDGSPSQDPDLSIRSREDDLPPLERARLRRSILPGGQTRLIP